MKESERLIAARNLIADEKNWMKGDYADNPEFPEEACKFCSLGAIHKVRGVHWNVGADLNTTSAYLRKVLAENGSYFCDVAEYNDTHTHAEVMQMFDKAIQIAQSEGN